MDDLISRQAAIDAAALSAAEWDGMYVQDINGRIRKALEQLPPAQPERKKGKWVKLPGMNEYCSACNQFFPLSYFQGRPFEINYCPHCGAMMEVAQDE